MPTVCTIRIPPPRPSVRFPLIVLFFNRNEPTFPNSMPRPATFPLIVESAIVKSPVEALMPPIELALIVLAVIDAVTN